MKVARILLILLLGISAQFIAYGQDDDKVVKADSTKKAKKAKTYADFVTDSTQSIQGLLIVHKTGNNYYFEIPDSVFGRDLMAITRIAKTPTGAGYGGELANKQVIRFERGPDKKVFVRVVHFLNVTPDTTQEIYSAVVNSNVHPIAASFDAKVIRQDTSILIDVSKFFTSGNQAFSIGPYVKQFYKLKSLIKDRTYVKRMTSYPINVEIRTVQTYAVTPPSIKIGESRTRTKDLVGGVNSGALTFEMNTSLIMLPKEPMRPRLFDQRVGIFANSYSVYNDDQQRVEPQVFAVRWRLEAKSEDDAQLQQEGTMIEPKKPIVFYIDPATPKKWVPYLKQGVEDWIPAFEQAGWKDAIVAKDWPENDSTMSLEDARYSVIRYFASNIQNAYGPNVNDPRSGEILESHIGWYHNVMKLVKNWYTTQTAAVDPRARENVFQTDLMGQLVRFVSAHEVGHTLGLRHNFGASNATPVEKLRDQAWLEKNGHTSSIMDYARFNYVAQPEDGVTDLIGKVGAYDRWAIEWNYKPIYGTANVEEDRSVLNNWYLEKAAGNPSLHFLTERSMFDPRAQSEDLGDNSMLASEYGIKNLKRILPNAIEWTRESSKDFDRAEEIYDNVHTQFRRYLGHVTKWVGGIYDTPKTYDQDGPVFVPAPRDMQRSAVSFLHRHLFTPPLWLFDKSVVNRIKAENGVKQLGDLQKRTINSLYRTDRLQRLIDSEAAVVGAYGLEEFFGDMQKGIWAEARIGGALNVYRRNLQKIHLEKLIALLSEGKESNAVISTYFRSTSSVDPMMSDIRSLAMGSLKELHGDLEKASKKAGDRMSRFHYQDCLHRIEEALDMKD